MGLSHSVFYIYAREQKSDKYAAEPIATLLYDQFDMNKSKAMGCFKREFYAFALGRDNYDEIKCIYLYQDSWRCAKVSRGLDNSVQIEFKSNQGQQLWDSCEEGLAPHRWPLLERIFSVQYPNCEIESNKITYMKN